MLDQSLTDETPLIHSKVRQASSRAFLLARERVLRHTRRRDHLQCRMALHLLRRCQQYVKQHLQPINEPPSVPLPAYFRHVGRINGCRQIIASLRPLLRRSGHPKETRGTDRTPFQPRVASASINLKHLYRSRVSFKLHRSSHQARPCCRVGEMRSLWQWRTSK
jgi:hypothetical protein